MKVYLLVFGVFLMLAPAGWVSAQEDEHTIDMQRAWELTNRQRQGATLTEDEAAFLDKATAYRNEVQQLRNGRRKGETLTSLNHDPVKGRVRSPWLAWGPYLWADGLKARSDGLTYARQDLGDDGTRPSMSGGEKVGKQLLAFLKSDPTARPWFAKAGERRSP